MPFPKFRAVVPLVELSLAAFAAVLWTQGVSWAFKPGLFLIQDELGNLARFLSGSYWQVITLLPLGIYNDRPTGFALERLLFDLFGFDYRRQLLCFLAIHLANCLLAFALFRRLGVSVPLSLAAIGVYGTLNTTVQTATYLGASFDVLCLFFILGSALALFSQKRGTTALSAILFFLALRSKEFAIVVPLLFIPLVVSQLPHFSIRQVSTTVVRKLWIHFVVAIAIGIRYLTFVPRLKTDVVPQNPYYMQLSAATFFQSVAYYTALVFGADRSPWTGPTTLIGLALAAILVYALIRRRMGLVFGIAAYVLTLLPVALMPKLRSVWYVYVPQVFLMLAICLLLEDTLTPLSKRERVRWTATVLVALACLIWGASFRRSSYFVNRRNFTLMVRSTCARSARQTMAQLPRLSAGCHFYVNHGKSIPWLFAPGPCDFLKVVNRQRSINCVMDGSEDDLRSQYERDRGAKYFVDYQSNGVLSVIGSPDAKN